MNIPLFDRDLSWLSFNYRVLMEAMDKSIPPLERLKFAAIYSSNLDEFFRVRVARLKNLLSIDQTKVGSELWAISNDTLNQIHESVSRQLNEYGVTLQSIFADLEQHGIKIHHDEPISSTASVQLSYYFKTTILAYLKPFFLSNHEQTLTLQNQGLYLALTLRKNGINQFAILNIPSNDLPRFHSIVENDLVTYYYLDDIIRGNIDKVFPSYEIMDCCSVKMNKDADLHIDDEYDGDLVSLVQDHIKNRELGKPSRFLFDQSVSTELLDALKNYLKLDEAILVQGGRYHNLNDYMSVKNILDRKVEFEKRPPVSNRVLDTSNSIFDAIDHHDQMLHFPYQSYDYILQLFNEAAVHPDVDEINVTFYRMAKNSIIGNALISAACNGKKVNVFMEVKARFDEENNIKWASKLEAAGVNMAYSMPELKVHAKVALIRMKTANKPKYYGFFGTGNLNESTAKVYCDHGLLTCNEELTLELNSVFEYLQERKKPPLFKHLIVSQFGAIQTFGALIDREIAHRKSGKPASIVIKLNNLEEPHLIAKLYEAAAADVDIRLIIRGICCLVPNTHGIKVIRVVGRYLEHARIFHFHNAGLNDVYMGSSDWMSRNLHKRVEVTYPILNRELKEHMLHILDFQLCDTQKGVELSETMENLRVDTGKKPLCSQTATYEFIKQLNGEMSN